MQNKANPNASIPVLRHRFHGTELRAFWGFQSRGRSGASLAGHTRQRSSRNAAPFGRPPAGSRRASPPTHSARFAKRNLHKRSLATAITPEDKSAALRAAVHRLEKTNPLWKPAKTKQSHCFRRRTIFKGSHFLTAISPAGPNEPNSLRTASHSKMQNKANPPVTGREGTTCPSEECLAACAGTQVPKEPMRLLDPDERAHVARAAIWRGHRANPVSRAYKTKPNRRTRVGVGIDNTGLTYYYRDWIRFSEKPESRFT